MDSTKGQARTVDAQDSDDDLRSTDSAATRVAEWELGELKDLVSDASSIARELQGQLNRLRMVVRHLEALRRAQGDGGRQSYL